jgi:hypothetical protein
MAHAPGGAGVYGQGGGEWLMLMITAGLSDFTEGMQRGTVLSRKERFPFEGFTICFQLFRQIRGNPFTSINFSTVQHGSCR